MDKQFQLGGDSAYWRLDMTPPTLRVGWETDQSANSKELTFNIDPTHFRANPRLDVTTTN
jgi:hypothetical protein